MKYVQLVLAVSVWMLCVGVAWASEPPFIIGADISWVQQQEDEGVRFSDQGTEKDILEILKAHGFNWIRLSPNRAPRGNS